MDKAKRLEHPETPFPIGVEYYRAPIPKQECWNEDFARLRAAGFRVIRSASYWNWMEPRPGQYELEDFDQLFDLAEKHGLYVWLDIMLSTHGACPEWLMREYPDMRIVNYRGEPAPDYRAGAFPQGGIRHCYDHPAWREYGGALLRHVVNRYKDRPNLLIWGLWDGVAPASSGHSEKYPCYCDCTVAKYKAWLRERFTLEELNRRLLRRYRRWEDVEPPRSNQAIVEMLPYRQFHYENLVDHLKWMVNEVEQIDPKHEMRAHSLWRPRPWDEQCACHVDSWGMSMGSNDLLTSEDPYKITERAFAFDWTRSVGRNGRWWNEEIYAGMSPAGVGWETKQSDPRELTMLLWMTLAGGAAGAMFWQYRPEYLSFESPGFNLVALDGEPTPRFEGVAHAIQQIEGLKDHLPLECPKADVAIVYHSQSHEVFGFSDRSLKAYDARYMADLRGVYRTLWTHGIPADVVTPRMDWSGYRLLFLPNVALMTEEMQQRIMRTLKESPETRLVAEGSFGMYSSDGQSSYLPPEGFAELFGMRVSDLSRVTERDIQQGQNRMETPYSPVTITTPCGYAVLEPRGGTKAIASLGTDTVAVRTEDGRFTWYGLTFSAGFGDVGQPTLVLGLAKEFGVQPPVTVEGDRVVPVVRRSRQGGCLLFLFNVEDKEAQVTLCPRWKTKEAQDLLKGSTLSLTDGAFSLTVEPWSVDVIHCADE